VQDTAGIEPPVRVQDTPESLVYSGIVCVFLGGCMLVDPQRSQAGETFWTYGKIFDLEIRGSILNLWRQTSLSSNAGEAF
jgi:hypothetical protein